MKQIYHLKNQAFLEIKFRLYIKPELFDSEEELTVYGLKALYSNTFRLVDTS